MDTEGMLAAAPLQLAQENDPSVHLLDGHVIVLDTRIKFLHLVQLMVVRGKERPRPPFLVFMDVLHDGPGDADAVVRRSTASQLIKEHKATRGYVVQDVGRLVHFHHERALPH